MSEKSGSSSGWLVAVLVLALGNFVQYSEKSSLQERIIQLEKAPQVSASLVPAEDPGPQSSVETDTLTPEQKDNLEAEKSFDEEKPNDVDPGEMGPGFRSEMIRQSDSKDSSQTDQYSGEFVGSARSDKFHNLYCSAANRIKAENLVLYRSRAEAVSAGKEPCKICSP